MNGKDNVAVLLINGNIDVKTVTAITTIANISMIEVIIEIML
jgi:hypothetical protein